MTGNPKVVGDDFSNPAQKSALTPGTKLGLYEIHSPLGVGGMSQAYRARDTRLDRTVAVKIFLRTSLAILFASSAFERDAKTISGLNHPHICTLHDIGSSLIRQTEPLVPAISSLHE